MDGPTGLKGLKGFSKDNKVGKGADKKTVLFKHWVR